MAGTSRIDELRKKFDENPRRYFAPLANEYRKIGDFEQAIFICQEFLPQQPGHMSGHIVYGQALFESGRHDEARSVFETALALDPENLIALRHLGDIARAHGDVETARAWYRRVLESDPRNDEIAGILASLDTDVPQAPVPAGAGGQAGAADAAAGGSLSIESAISAATGSEEAPEAASPDPIVTDPLTTAPSESNFDDIAKLFTSAGAAPAPPPPAAETAKPSEDSLNLIHEGEDVLVTDSTTAEEARAHLDALVAGREVAKQPSEPAAAETATPSFSLPFLEGLTSPAPSAEREPEPAAPPAAPPASPSPAPEPPRASAPDAGSAFVTETMAELYIKQGHRDQALEVYRQLVQRNPGDAALAARLRELETADSRPVPAEPAPPPPPPEVVADAGPTIREFLESIALGRPRSGNSHAPQAVAADVPNEPPRGRAPASVTDSLGALFANAEQGSGPSASPMPPRADDFSAPAEEAHPAPLPGRPSKPAASELSLDHVFRHATPAAGNPSQSFSFDQFFSQQAQQDVAASDASPAGEQSAGLSDDIQQFNAWLEGLKKS